MRITGEEICAAPNFPRRSTLPTGVPGRIVKGGCRTTALTPISPSRAFKSLTAPSTAQALIDAACIT